MDSYGGHGRTRSFSPSQGRWQGGGRAWKDVNKVMQVYQTPHQNQPPLAFCAMDMIQIKEALATFGWEDVIVTVYRLAQMLNNTRASEEELQRRLELLIKRNEESVHSMEWQKRRIWELQQEMEATARNSTKVKKKDLSRHLEVMENKHKVLVQSLQLKKKRISELEYELGKREKNESLLYRLTVDMETKRKKESELARELESRNILAKDLQRELESKKKNEEVLMKDLLVHKKRASELQQEMDASKQREEKLVQDLEANFKVRKTELLTNLESKKIKKVEEDLLMKFKNIQQDRQREQDSWLSEKRNLLDLYDQALKQIKNLQYDVTIEKEKSRNDTLNIQEWNKNFALIQKQFQEDYANKNLELSTFKIQFENMKKEKDQIEQQLHNKLIEHKTSFECKESEVAALQAQLVQTKEEKKHHLIQIEKLITRRKELVLDINSRNSLLIDHLSTLMVNLKDFERLLHNADLADSQVLAICNNHGLEGKISNQDVTHKRSDSQEIVENKSELEFPLIAINLLQMINALKSTLNEIAIVWKQKHSQLEMKIELKSKEKEQYQYEIFQELGHFATPLLDIFENQKKKEGLIRREEKILVEDLGLQISKTKECHESQLLAKDPPEKTSNTKGKTKVTTSTSKRKISIKSIGDNKKSKDI